MRSRERGSRELPSNVNEGSKVAFEVFAAKSPKQEAMASNLLTMASNLLAMASNLLRPATYERWPPT